MTSVGTLESPLSCAAVSRPVISSYDLGYEHSQDHFIALQSMLQDVEEVVIHLRPMFGRDRLETAS